MASSNQKKGIIIAIIAGILWGFSGTCAQYIFDGYAVTPLYLCSLRMLFGGAILTIYSLIKDRDKVKQLFADKFSLIQLILFAFLGVLFNQVSYLLTISYTNSGTATILQYIGPVFVMIVNCFIQKRLPEKREVLAVIFVTIGTFLIATHGNIHTLYITPIGLVWGLLSAVALVFYTMIPGKLIASYGAIPVTGLAMLLGGIAISPFSATFTTPVPANSVYLISIFVIIIFGTVLPYTMYLIGLHLCGPVKASMVASIEPVSATLCMVLWLGEPFYKAEFFGFIFIFLTIFLLAKKKKEEKKE